MILSFRVPKRLSVGRAMPFECFSILQRTWYVGLIWIIGFLFGPVGAHLRLLVGKFPPIGVFIGVFLSAH